MSKDVTLSLRVDRKLSGKLEKHARQMGRSKSSVATRAIEEHLVAGGEEIARIKAALERSRAGAPAVAHADVVRWLKSWGSENETPPPRAKVRR